MSYCLGILAASWMALGRLTPLVLLPAGPESPPVSSSQHTCEERQSSPQKGRWRRRHLGQRGGTHTVRHPPRPQAGQGPVHLPADLAATVSLQVSLLGAAAGAHPAIREPSRSPQREVPRRHLSGFLTPGIRAACPLHPPPHCPQQGREVSAMLGPCLKLLGTQRKPLKL